MACFCEFPDISRSDFQPQSVEFSVVSLLALGPVLCLLAMLSLKAALHQTPGPQKLSLFVTYSMFKKLS